MGLTGLISACSSCLNRLLVLALAAFALPVWSADLTLYTEEYPPINFSKNGKATGLATEVVEEIERRLGVTYPVQVIPWARAYKEAQSVPNTVLFAAMRSQERENLFKWVGPLTTVNAGLYARKGSRLHISKLDDARNVNGIIVPREWWTHQILRGMGFANLEAVANPEQMVKMLMAGRGTLMATDNQTLSQILALGDAKPDDVELVQIIVQSQSYIIFSKSTPDDVIAAWQRTLDEMKRDGSFARIYARWLPNDAPPGVEPSKETWPVKKQAF